MSASQPFSSDYLSSGGQSRAAIIYLPGLFNLDSKDELSVIGRKLAVSLDKSACDGKPVFEAGIDYVEQRGEKVRICRLQRRDRVTDQPKGVADLFLMDYRPKLLQRHQQRSLPGKMVLTSWAVMVMLGKVLRHALKPRHKVKLFRDRVQIVFALAGAVLMGIYLATLILATAKVVTDTGVELAGLTRDVSSSSIITTTPTASDGGSGSFLTVFSATAAWVYERSLHIFVALTALGLLMPNRQQLWQGFVQMSEEMLAFTNYCSFGERRGETTGALENFVEKVMEAGEGKYDRYIILSYSFGSIVAIDTFFPTGNVRAERLNRVQSLVTIGSPHDFILTFWPDYFANRNPRLSRPEQWINIYSPIDVLASQFNTPRKQSEHLMPSVGREATLDEKQAPTMELGYREGVPEEKLSFASWLLLMGLRSHTMYWSHDEDGERNCFDELVPFLFPDLAASRAAIPSANASRSASATLPRSNAGQTS